MSYNVNPFNPDNEYSNQISTELNQANENFNVLAQAFKDNDPNTGIVKHAIISDIALYGETVVNNINKYEFSFIPFSRLNVSKDGKPPYSHNLYTSYYSLPDNKLYYFDGNKWVEVNWQDWVLNDPWYLLGKLRIYNGELQISNDGVNWHKIIPTVGRCVEFVHDGLDYSVILEGQPLYYPIYLAVGQTYYGSSTNILNIACVSPSIWEMYDNDKYNRTWGGIYPSGQFVSGGWNSVLIANGYSINTIEYLDMQVIDQKYTDPSYAEIFKKDLDHLSLYFNGRGGRYVVFVFDNQMFSINLYKVYGVGYGVSACPFPSNGYYLGATSSYMYKTNNMDAFNYISITRRL